MKTTFARAMPLFTPATMMMMVTAHTARIGKKTRETMSKDTPTLSATFRNSPMKKPSASSPHALLSENQAYMAAQPMIAA